MLQRVQCCMPLGTLQQGLRVCARRCQTRLKISFSCRTVAFIVLVYRLHVRRVIRCMCSVFQEVLQPAATCVAGRTTCHTTMQTRKVDTKLNPRVVALKLSKTMALTDLASSMREKGIDVVGLAAGEPDFDTPNQILEAGIEALRCHS